MIRRGLHDHGHRERQVGLRDSAIVPWTGDPDRDVDVDRLILRCHRLILRRVIAIRYLHSRSCFHRNSNSSSSSRSVGDIPREAQSSVGSHPRSSMSTSNPTNQQESSVHRPPAQDRRVPAAAPQPQWRPRVVILRIRRLISHLGWAATGIGCDSAALIWATAPLSPGLSTRTEMFTLTGCTCCTACSTGERPARPSPGLRRRAAGGSGSGSGASTGVSGGAAAGGSTGSWRPAR